MIIFYNANKFIELHQYDVGTSQQIKEQQIYPFTIKNGNEDY